MLLVIRVHVCTHAMYNEQFLLPGFSFAKIFIIRGCNYTLPHIGSVLVSGIVP